VQTVLLWHLSLLKLLPFFRIPDAKTVLFLHGIEAWKPQDWLTRRLLRRVDLFLSNSEYTWQRFLSYNPYYQEATHRTVHLGVDTPLDTPVAAPAHLPVVLMLGRLLRSEDYKGHREMITTWPLVRQRLPEAELWIAGDGDLQSDLQTLAQVRGLESCIRFYGHVSEQEKQQLLMRCRCLALPSRAEGFGLVYLEAMRMGRPCLVSTLDAGREVVNPPEAGLAVTPQDPQALAEAVCRLVTPGQEWQHWSEQARCRYEQHFTAEQFQRRLVAALGVLTDDRGRETADLGQSMVSGPRSSFS
jgi:phosphatidylinositol alpha-1,6-mannosyltransferase